MKTEKLQRVLLAWLSMTLAGSGVKAAENTIGAFFDDVEQTANLGGGWYWNSLMGYGYGNHYPYLFTLESVEWLWVAGDTAKETTGYFFYRFGGAQWGWTSSQYYPWYVEYPSQQWRTLKVEVPDGDYLVIDLSGGANATSYPVSYLTSVPGGGWTDEYKTTKLVLRRIPKGTFTMGSPSGELGRYSDETQHQVTLTKDFYIGVFEVTQRQWELVMGYKPSYFNNASHYTTRPVEQVSYYDIRENPANSDDPAVNWPANAAVNAASFMGKLRARTGLSDLDLPTEAQWEYACRAGTTTALNSGVNLTGTGQDPEMDKVGRYYYNHPGGYSYSLSVSTDGGTAKVGSYQPNAWGLYDMHGNVYEWCLDWYTSAYGSGAVSDPPGAVSGSSRVRRGGSWGSYARSCRSAIRGHSPSYRNLSDGFRLARTLP